LVVNYDASTRMLVCIASITIVTNAVGSTYQDVLQALEKMREVALSQLLGGLSLTLLSATVLLLGGSLCGVAVVYVLGNTVTMALAFWYVRVAIGIQRFQWSWLFARTSIVSAAPFFVPTLVAMAGTKIGVILLSVLGHDAAVGLFGAANGLVDRLQIIPDGICTAIYPTLIVLYKESREEACRLYRKYYEYLLTLGLPIAVGGTLLAKPIMILVYGSGYNEAVPALQVLTWWLCLSFLTSLQSWSLAAVHEERKPALVAFIATPLYALLNLVLIPWGFALGAAWANVGAQLLSFVMLTYFVQTRFTKNALPLGRLLRVLAANTAMGSVVYLVRHLNVFVAIGIGAATYALFLPMVGVVGRSDFERLREMIAARVQASRRAE
jgi:O-antigen/teichoic acid export membrane protein